MNENESKLVSKLNLFLKVVTDEEAYNSIKSIVKKAKIDSVIAKIQNFLAISEESKSIDKKEAAKIKSAIAGLRDYLSTSNLANNFAANINNLEKIIDSLRTKYKIGPTYLSDIVLSYNRLSDLAADLQENPESKDFSNQASTCLYYLMEKINNMWKETNQKTNLWNKTNSNLRKTTEKVIAELCTMNGVINFIDDFLLQYDTSENAKFNYSSFFQPKSFNYIKDLIEIPYDMASDFEKDMMNRRKKELAASYQTISLTFQPMKQLEIEHAENKRLTALYRASLMSKEDLENLKKENENLKQIIKELEQSIENQKNSAPPTPKKPQRKKKSK